jgi:hypothetical protein
MIELDTHDGEHEPDTHSIASDQSTSGTNDATSASPSAKSTAPDGGSN